MSEQQSKPEAFPPAEGRSDVAGSVEEEKQQAYSAHPEHSAQKPDQSPFAPITDAQPPAEGRADIAGSVEEEQRNAYSNTQQTGKV